MTARPYIRMLAAVWECVHEGWGMREACFGHVGRLVFAVCCNVLIYKALQNGPFRTPKRPI